MKQIVEGIYWFLGQGMDSNVYLIESDGERLLIDSGLCSIVNFGYGANTSSLDELERIITEKILKQVYLTHGHIDHVGGVMALQSKHNLEITTFDSEANQLERGNSSYIEPFTRSKCQPILVKTRVNHGDTVNVGRYNFQILHTPGHTEGSTSLWEPDAHILVSGDTVFPEGSFGRTDLPSGNSKQLLTSLKNLSKLEVHILLPGHMPPVISDSGFPITSVNKSYQNARIMLSYY
ncbi:MAG: MBL fold metallo-hydrolase [Candidatus Heimdallarchaeota archaeon]|nr:MBL fold metallo-hydrolase [Candidatus Heimdallarchaeota archaeon]